MSDSDQDCFQDECLADFRGRVDTLVAELSRDSLKKEIRDIIEAQMSIDLLNSENYVGMMNTIKTGSELVKRVAAETYDYLSMKNIRVKNVPSDITLEITSKTQIKIGEREETARSHFLYNMIEHDDLEKLQDYVVTHPDFSLSEIRKGVGLLDIACLTGSPKIFSYLLANECRPTGNTEVMCVMGGCREIMEILSREFRKEFRSYQVVRAAVLYHRHDILDDLVRKNITDGLSIQVAIESRNTYAFLHTLKTSGKIEISDVQSAVEMSATGILKVLCDLFAGIFAKLPYTLSDSWFMLSQDDRVADVFGALSKYGNRVSIRVCEECLLDAEALTRPCVSDLPFDTAREGNIDGLRYFVGTVGPDAESEDGVPLIDYAIMSGDVNVVLFLLSEGADPRVTDVDGRGCLWYSVVHANKSPEIFRLIYSLGVREFRAECAAYSRLPPDNPIHQFYYSMRKSEDNVVFKDRTNSLRANPTAHFATPYEPF